MKTSTFFQARNWPPTRAAIIAENRRKSSIINTFVIGSARDAAGSGATAARSAAAGQRSAAAEEANGATGEANGATVEVNGASDEANGASDEVNGASVEANGAIVEVHDGSEALLGESLRITQRLAESDSAESSFAPRTNVGSRSDPRQWAAWQRDLSVSHYKLAMFARQNGDNAGVEAELRKCYLVLHQMPQRNLHFDPQMAQLDQQLAQAVGG